VAQKPDLANQVKALETYCKQQSITVDAWMPDIGSGLDYKRKQFNRFMEMIELGQVRHMVIAHKDRLVRCHRVCIKASWTQIVQEND
jgi:putative resolvase